MMAIHWFCIKIHTKTNFCKGSNKSFPVPNSFGMMGKLRTRNWGTGNMTMPMFPLLANLSTSKTRFLKVMSSRWNRLPPIIAHRILMTETLNMDLNSTVWLRSDSDDSLISLIKSWISSIIWSSIDVFPNPKSLKWRNVNRLCSCQNGPSEKIKPEYSIIIISNCFV